MAFVGGDKTESENDYVFELKAPGSIDLESSNLCVKTLGNENVIIGNEQGAFVTSLEYSLESVKVIKKFDGKEVPTVCVESDNHDIFYVASEKRIDKYDFRCPLDKEVCSFSENTDEINEITINESGLLASCDDSGECKIYDTKKNILYRTLRNRHKNICSSAVFLPSRSDDIVTGGLDSQIIAWNYTTVRYTQGINTQDLLQKLGDNSVNMFNPPMVNSLSTSNDGKMVAAGLGNGSLQVFNVLKGKTVLSPSLLINHHASTGITAVHFLDTESKDSYFLASGGNDAEINIWKTPPVSLNNKKKQIIPVNHVVIEEEEITNFNVKRIKLETKINSLHSTKTNNKTILLVADQTPIVKCYDITSCCE